MPSAFLTHKWEEEWQSQERGEDCKYGQIVAVWAVKLKPLKTYQLMSSSFGDYFLCI